MFLKNIKLINFRNFSKLELNFPQTTILIGKNAQGKSNLLESIYYLATTKSQRVERDVQFIKQGENFCRVEGEIKIDQRSKIKDQKEEVTKLEIVMQINQEDSAGLATIKRVKVNGIPRRTIDYIGNLVAVYFAPEDINLVSGSPSLRRFHLDLILSQIDRNYKKVLAQYSAALIARNRLLKGIKEGTSKMSELDFWTNQTLESGQIVSGKRRDFFLDIDQQVKLLGKDAPSLGQFRFVYQESVISSQRLKIYLPKEIEASATLIGPHRDDFVFELNGKNLAYFGSRGEARTAVLELKLAELKVIQHMRDIKPILLLDDVFSELDLDHQEYVISQIGYQQTMISAVETEPIPIKFRKSAKVILVEQGTITEIT